MDIHEKEEFILQLTENIARAAIAKIPHMPSEWDGHELRRYLADKFEESAITVGRKGPYGKPYQRRYREYKNAVIVRNL